MKKIFILLFSILFYSSLLFSQVEVSSRLQQAISEANPDDYIRVLVLLRDQVDVVAMDEQFYRESIPIPQRVTQLINQLQTKASETQVNLLSYIEEKTQSGKVFQYESFWIANLVMVEAKVEVINEIMFRLDVSQIDLDAILELDKPIEVIEKCT
ncbi:MAG: hypothetical protein U5J96_07470 [Ignavibacteriaceae bacterium]|nr:hypothetical protein [Ignavibacteriaceae bacterium]